MRRLLVPAAGAALAVTVTFPGAARPDPSPTAAGSGAIMTSARDYHVNLGAPKVDLESGGEEALDLTGKRPSSPGNPPSDLRAWWAGQSKKRPGGPRRRVS